MRKTLISLLFIVVALFAADRAVGMAMWWINQHTQDLTGPKLRYLAEKATEDVILMGTSRCNFHYVPSVLSDSLGMSVYNGGVNGSKCIYAHYIVLNQILRHHTPRLICLELMTEDYDCADDALSTVSFFAPYFGRSERADSVFRLAGNYWKYKLSHLYRYNAKAISNVGGLFYSQQTTNDHGYNPNPQPEFFPSTRGRSVVPERVDSNKLMYVRKFISLCKEKGIKLVFMVSPMYTMADEDLYAPLKRVAQKNGVPFLDYHTSGLFLDHPEYFRDERHLWDKGARIYTSIFARDLKIVLSKRSCHGIGD